MMHLDASSVASLFYDGKTGRYVGKQARKYQTWSIVGYFFSKDDAGGSFELGNDFHGRGQADEASVSCLFS